ncbi:hypothetical protein CP556_23790 [Natrinema sp. CBA1119]|uniref:hypothetical protein n=1 Tax=Natrinema sp. CBA1119 TaxID=1608465 RepID=UPI000BF86D05|nr:hypothetical protein [Natrinema sp. CBA1119]PGF14079.1 hypothetical protein CP556_23790 [Natrinema sp. CBA1119]
MVVGLPLAFSVSPLNEEAKLLVLLVGTSSVAMLGSVALALLAGVNNGIGSGGYGPVVTLGRLLSR